MFNLINCFKAYNGKTYCFDICNRSFIEFTINPVNVKEVPVDVLYAIAAKAAEGQKSISIEVEDVSDSASADKS